MRPFQRKGMKAAAVAAALLVMGAGPARESRAADPAIEELEKKVEVLTEEVERLKHGSADVEAKESFAGMGPAASKIYYRGKGVSIGGYGEVIYENKADHQPDSSDALRAILYTGYRFSDSILFNGEIEFEHAVAGEGKKGEVAVEFLYVDFLINRHANVRGGMLLIPVGMINEMHEPVTFHGVLRPDVERNVIPSTWRENGVGLHGEIVGDLTYKLVLTTGLDSSGFKPADGIRGGRQSGSKAKADDLAYTTRLTYKGVPGLSLGASFYYGKSDQRAKVDVDGDGSTGNFDGAVSLLDIDAEYLFRGLEVRGLFATVKIGDADAISKLSGKTIGERLTGWYAEAAYDVFGLTGVDGYLAPFVRYEAYDTQADVPSGLKADGANDKTVTTMGLSYKPVPNVVVKGDYQVRDDKADKSANQFNLGIGYNF